MFAWQGFAFPLGDRWRPSVLSGAYQQGYVCLESDDELIWQIRWKQGRPPASLGARANEYLSKIERVAKRRKQPFSSIVHESDNRADYEWHADHKGYGTVRYEPQTRRVFMIELSGRKQESLKREMRSSISDFEDIAGATLPWSVLGLNVALPRNFKLHSWKMVSGRITLSFRSRGWSLQAERWAFANQLVQKHGLQNWSMEAAGIRSCVEHPLGIELKQQTVFGQRSALVRHFPDSNKIILIKARHPKRSRLEWDWIP
jgi:hypothetical protein